MIRLAMAAIFLGSILPSGAFAGHPASDRCDSNPTYAVRISGSVPLILAPLLQRWTQASARMGITVETAPPGPPQGALDPALAEFLDGKRDFAFLTRAIAEEDLARFRRAHGTDPVVVPVAGGSWNRFGYVDPVVVIVNAANPVRSLDFAQIDAIFSESRLRGHPAIRDWGAVGVAAWRGKPIRLVGGDAWSVGESARALTVRHEVLSTRGRAGRWKAAPGSGGEADNVERVARDPLAIGFTGAGHVLPGTRVVPIRSNGYGAAVMPTRDAVASGRYPLARTVDLLVARRQDGTIAPALARFIYFIAGPEGQAVVASDGTFLPLTNAQAAVARHAIRNSPAC